MLQRNSLIYAKIYNNTELGCEDANQPINQPTKKTKIITKKPNGNKTKKPTTKLGTSKKKLTPREQGGI